jgi:hypothetical protein
MIAAQYRDIARKCRLNASLNLKMTLEPHMAETLAEMLDKAALQFDEPKLSPSSGFRIATPTALLVVAAGVSCLIAGIGGSSYFNAKGKTEAAIQLAKHGASAAAVDCILRPELPFFNSRCRAILDLANARPLDSAHPG